MIIELKQTRSTLGADFVFSSNNNPELFTAQIRLSIGSPDIRLLLNNELVYSLSGNGIPIDFKGAFQRERTLFNIKSPSGEICGNLSSKVVKKFLAGYRYVQINFKSELYNCYEVGMGKEGKFICIYIGDQQIAMIEKPTVVYDNKDYYKIYIKDSKYIDIVCLFAVYYDHASARNYNEVVIKSKKVSYEYTINKELKSKYNPKFKEQC